MDQRKVGIAVGVFLCIVSVVGVGYLVRSAFSSRLPVTKIAIVDGIKLRKNVSLHPQIERVLSETWDNLNKTSQEMKGRLTHLSQLSKDTKLPLKKRAEYKNKFLQEHEHVEDEIQQLRTRYWEKLRLATELINSVVFSVIKDIAKKYQINVILNASGLQQIVMYSEEKLDITDETIQEVQKRLAKISTLKGLND